MNDTLSAEICTVGTELLLGQIVDTNAAYIAQALARVGVNVFYRSGVGDNLERVQSVIRLALTRADAIILTGGLGPTQDDLTTEALAGVFGEKLVEDPETLEKIRERVRRLNVTVGNSSYRMAMVPEHVVVMPNGAGMAPGIWLEKNGKLAIALPGVPSEMRHLMDGQVLPRLQSFTGKSSQVIRSRVLRTVGIAESLAEEKILDLVGSENPTVAPYAGQGEIKLRITARAPDETAAAEMIARMEAKVRERLDAYIFGTDDESLDRAVGRLLLEQGLTISTAESCTAGLVGAALTEMPGSSGYFAGGVMAYSNEIKVKMLGVPGQTLTEYGAVSPETAAAMAEGVRRVYGTDLGVAVTGIAGPGGGSADKPVGLVYLGLADADGAATERRQFGGDRSDVRRRTVMAALQILYARLRHGGG